MALPTSRTSAFRSFATRPLGRAILIAVAIPAVGWSFIYLGELIAVVAMLLLGLLLPITMGWKRPRQLAVAGLVILLLSSPVAGALETNLAFSPSPIASSSSALPDGNHGSVLQNASVGPFSGASGTNFTFGVDLFPKYVPPNETLTALVFVVSTCPTATGNVSSPDCSSGYPYFLQNHTFATPPNTTTHLRFNQKLPGPDIWWWTMYTETRATNGSYHYTFLSAGSGYPTIQGPVTGDWFSIYGIVLEQVYIYVFLYAGSVFYLALLAYTWFKVREARRKAAAAGSVLIPPAPPMAPGGGGATAGPAAIPSGPVEMHCPNCQAVVYESEKKCWKCGTPLGVAATPIADAPLPSSGPAQPPKSGTP
ncbi:MAG: hypothetical protein L3K07_02930 [Thermoplasmata archaeon]|nr:hypothetical protein [Thermoplasmata archaeon]